MLVAYYSKGCDSKELFSTLKVSQKNTDISNNEQAAESKRMERYEVNLNQHNVIRLWMGKSNGVSKSFRAALKKYVGDGCGSSSGT